MLTLIILPTIRRHCHSIRLLIIAHSMYHEMHYSTWSGWLTTVAVSPTFSISGVWWHFSVTISPHTVCKVHHNITLHKMVAMVFQRMSIYFMMYVSMWAIYPHWRHRRCLDFTPMPISPTTRIPYASSYRPSYRYNHVRRLRVVAVIHRRVWWQILHSFSVDYHRWLTRVKLTQTRTAWRQKMGLWFHLVRW